MTSKKITKTVVRKYTRDDFERIVYECMLSDFETEVFDDYIRDVSMFESAERLNTTPRKICVTRTIIKRKIEQKK